MASKKGRGLHVSARRSMPVKRPKSGARRVFASASRLPPTSRPIPTTPSFLGARSAFAKDVGSKLGAYSTYFIMLALDSMRTLVDEAVAYHVGVNMRTMACLHQGSGPCLATVHPNIHPSRSVIAPSSRRILHSAHPPSGPKTPRKRKPRVALKSARDAPPLPPSSNPPSPPPPPPVHPEEEYVPPPTREEATREFHEQLSKAFEEIEAAPAPTLSRLPTLVPSELPPLSMPDVSAPASASSPSSLAMATSDDEDEDEDDEEEMDEETNAEEQG